MVPRNKPQRHREQRVKLVSRKAGVIGRYCSVCGGGMSYRKGGLVGATPILKARSYEIPTGNAMYFAHVRCLTKKE